MGSAFFLLSQSCSYRHCTCFFALAVDMPVNVGGGSHIALSQPILNHFHRHTINYHNHLHKSKKIKRFYFMQDILTLVIIFLHLTISFARCLWGRRFLLHCQMTDFGKNLFLSLFPCGLNFAVKCCIIYFAKFDFTERRYER